MMYGYIIQSTARASERRAAPRRLYLAAQRTASSYMCTHARNRCSSTPGGHLCFQSKDHLENSPRHVNTEVASVTH